MPMKMFKKSTFFLLIALFILVTAYYTGNRVYAQENEQLEITDLKYPMYEYADKIDQVNNTQSIGIALPSDTWNVTKFELNFTDIKLGKETKEFEVYDSGFKVIEIFIDTFLKSISQNLQFFMVLIFMVLKMNTLIKY